MTSLRGTISLTLLLGVGAAEQGAFRNPHHPKVDPTSAAVVIETRRIVPSDGLPSTLPIGTSNNNLDVVRHDDGFTYLAWRTAPDHYASTTTMIHVVRSRDEQNWESDVSFSVGHDLREPRFLSFKGRLILHLAKLGQSPFAFEPNGMLVSERNANGRWSKLSPSLASDFIPWRARVHDGQAYLTGYVGGGDIYHFEEDPLKVLFLRSDDGLTWTPAGQDPVVIRGGASETDYFFRPDGSLIAVARNEAGDASGWGTKICRAPADKLSNWTCRSDARRFDSPHLFGHQGRVFLLARRNVTDNGHYALHASIFHRAFQSIHYQLAYLRHRKRCALWRVDPDSLEVGFLVDLPSKGDTCFPVALAAPHNEDEVIVYDYSSAIEGPDYPWYLGQRYATFIYRHVLKIRPTEGPTTADGKPQIDPKTLRQESSSDI